jgi:hypothetical protein
MSQQTPRGPRIAFKVSAPAAVLYAEFFEPGPARLLRAFALEAPSLKGGVLVVTSVWRPAGETPSLHPELLAIDVRTGVDDTRLVGSILGSTREDRYAKAEAWAERVRRRVGVEYDIVYGEAVRHVDHIHGEWDRRKRRSSFA